SARCVSRMLRAEGATGWRVEVDNWTNGHNSRWINVPMAHVVMPLDVHQVHGRGDARPVVELARIGPKIGVIDQSTDVTLEVPRITRIEANERGKEPPVGFRGLLS